MHQRQQKPTTEVVATIVDINATWQNTQFGLKLKRFCRLSANLPPALGGGNIMVCWNREQLALGKGAKYAFKVTADKGKTITFVNIVEALKIEGIPEYPSIPEKPAPEQTNEAAPTGSFKDAIEGPLPSGADEALTKAYEEDRPAATEFVPPIPEATRSYYKEVEDEKDRLCTRCKMIVAKWLV